MEPLITKATTPSGDAVSAPRPVRALLDRFSEWIRRLGRTPRIGLALGSGASWGVAHIGVLSAFHELNIPISFLSGTSSGSLVGALYAGGLEGPPLEAYGKEYRWSDAGRLRYFPKMGLASNERMGEYLEKRIGKPLLENLRIPFQVVATDLQSGKPRVFNKGPVIPAVLASCAIPGIFEPVEIEGRLYCDGGLVDPLPCRILKEAGADMVIGVELSAMFEKRKRPSTIVEVISRALEIALIRPLASENQPADLIIRPNLDDIREFGFDQNDLLIQRGKQEALDRLRQWTAYRQASEGPRTETTV